MTARQMRWAAQHDWYNCAGILDDGTYEISVRDDEGEAGAALIFTDFNKLYTWAGY